MHPIITTQTNIAAGLLGVVLLTSLGLSYGSENWKPVEVEETWEGTVRIGLSGEVPVKGYVASDDAWAKLWNLYRRDAKLWNAHRSDEKLPSVDFRRDLILVAVGDDPNKIWIKPEVDEEGDLKFRASKTLRIYTNPEVCSYQFVRIKIDGIKTIEGAVISKKPTDRVTPIGAPPNAAKSSLQVQSYMGRRLAVYILAAIGPLVLILVTYRLIRRSRSSAT
ncbi:hypothetical protein N9089_01625 [Crocinitomicaceae bacterium]|nr:hypothetical protein [Crocinitomicaceae bacterium]